jgi:hypothetical protein
MKAIVWPLGCRVPCPLLILSNLPLDVCENVMEEPDKREKGIKT